MKYLALVFLTAALLGLPKTAAAQHPDLKSPHFSRNQSRRAWLGISLGRLTPALRRKYKYRYRYGGVLVKSVAPNSPAQKYNIQKGDIVMRIDGKYVYKPKDVIRIISRHQPGDRIKIDTYRYGSWRPVKLVLGKSHKYGSPTIQPFRRKGRRPHGGGGAVMRRRRFIKKLIAEIRKLRQEVDTLKKQVRQLQKKCGGGSGNETNDGQPDGNEPRVPPPAPSR
jgi:membrane-associated protease RseP (regulator of RpoE activity)